MAFHGTGSNVNQTVSVNAATYGSGNAIPVITVDSNKRISAINTASVTYGTLNANTNVGSVGSYAFMQQASGNTQYAPGDNLAGSSLRYSDATGRMHNDTPSGNWKCMGYDSGAALTNSGTVGGSAAGSGSLQGGNVQGNLTANVSGNVQGDASLSSGNVQGNISGNLQGGNVQGNKNVNVSGNIQGGKGGSFNVTPSVDTDELSVAGSWQGDTDELSVAGNIATDELGITGTTGTIDTDQLGVAGNVSVNVNLGSITVNTTVAYSSTLWLRYS
tara:strand:- start:563 stop:1384 length:822 start_codon:yes stop_codon:yes gene_type:complete